MIVFYSLRFFRSIRLLCKTRFSIIHHPFGCSAFFTPLASATAGRRRGRGVRGNHKTLIPPMSLLNLMPMGRFANRPCIGTSSSERTRSHNNSILYEQLFEQRTSAFLRFVCLFTYKPKVFPTAQTMCPSVRHRGLALRLFSLTMESIGEGLVFAAFVCE